MSDMGASSDTRIGASFTHSIGCRPAGNRVLTDVSLYLLKPMPMPAVVLETENSRIPFPVYSRRRWKDHPQPRPSHCRHSR